MGLDYGAKTVGVAVSDPLGLTAQAVETIFRERESKLRRTLARIGELIAEYGAERIVLGLPVHMGGEPGERARKTQEFAELLRRRFGLPVELWDERLSTAAADDILEESGVPVTERKKYIDKIAAALILEDYMRARGGE